MDMFLRDPLTNIGQVIDKEGHAVISAISESIQHHNSHTIGQAYQVKGTATPIVGTATVLHLRNNSTDLDLVVNYIRCQLVNPTGGTAIPNPANYFTVGFNRTYSAGGTLAPSVNMNPTSGNSAASIVYTNSPTLAGTALYCDDEYPASDANLVRWAKEGSIVLQPNATMEVSYIGDHTGGVAYSRVSYLMQTKT